MKSAVIDRYSCYQYTQQFVTQADISEPIGISKSQVIPSCGAFNACIAARGYLRSDNRHLEVLPGAVIQCHLSPYFGKGNEAVARECQNVSKHHKSGINSHEPAGHEASTRPVHLQIWYQRAYPRLQQTPHLLHS